MYKVTFLSGYRSIPASFSFETESLDTPVKLNGIVFDSELLTHLDDEDIVFIDNMDDDGCGCCGDDTCEAVSSNVVSLDMTSEDAIKVLEANENDLLNEKFVYGTEYKFYDVARKVWKTSRLKKTGSHIGRIIGGFAVPADATPRKMFNRLEKLSRMYDLGISRETAREITGYIA